MGVGFSELCIIAIFALIFIGPQKLPNFMRDLAKFFVQARRISNEVKASFEDVIQEAERDALSQSAEKPKPALPADFSEAQRIETRSPSTEASKAGEKPNISPFEHLSTHSAAELIPPHAQEMPHLGADSPGLSCGSGGNFPSSVS